MYYTERKPKNKKKKTGRPENEATISVDEGKNDMSANHSSSPTTLLVFVVIVTVRI